MLYYCLRDEVIFLEIKDYIKKRRLELELTLEQVGNYVGVGKGTVAKWESGFISNLGRDKIAKLSEILQISPLDIIYDNIETPHDIITNEKNENKSLSEIDPQFKTLLFNVEQLNKEGIEKLVAYSDDLVSSGKYKKMKLKQKAI